MKKLLFLIFFIVLQYSYAQNEADGITPSFYDVQNVPATPEMSNLGQYGNEGINKYTGQANIVIPIYDITFEELTIPINLAYNTSGIRVNQDATWVGLGWNLSEGMSITRQINGYDDLNTSESDSKSLGWIFSPDYIETPSYPDYLHNEILGSSLFFLRGEYVAGVPHDTQPDIFTINLPGGSVDFLLPKRQGIENILNGKVIGDKNYIIKYFIDAKVFEITDKYGFVYSFQTKELSTSYTSSDAPNVSEDLFALQGIPPWSTNQTRQLIKAWKITSVESVTGRILNFNYEDGFYLSFPHFSETAEFVVSYNSQPSVERSIGSPLVHANFTAFNSKYLTGISGDFGRINFNLINRKDLFSGEALNAITGGNWIPRITPHTPNSKALGSVEVYNFQNDLIKSANFNFSYFNSHKEFDNHKEKYLRLKLNSVLINDKKYSFSYINENELAPKDSKATDFWGFYNGKITNNHRIPSSNRFYYELFDNYEQFYKINGVDRSSDFNYGKIGLLNRITYPTGGYVEYDYEGNNVSLQNINYEPTVLNSGKIKSNLNSSDSYNFKYQYLKLAKDPNYSLFDLNQCSVSNQLYSASGSNFSIASGALCDGRSYNVEVNATLSCSVGCNQGVNPSGPAVWIENVDTGETINVFYYENQFDANTFSVQLSKEIDLPPGNYTFKHQNWSISEPYTVVANCSASIVHYSQDTGNPAITEKFEVGGARIANITAYDENNNVSYQKSFAYDQELDGLINSSGKLMDNLIFHSKGNYFYEYTPEDFGDGTNYNSNENTTPNAFFLHSDNKLLTNPSAQGSIVGYSKVIEKTVDDTDSNGKVETVFLNQSNDYIKRDIGCTIQFQTKTPNLQNCTTDYSCFDDFVRSGMSCFFWKDNNYGDQQVIGYGETYILGVRPVSFEHLNGKILKEEIYDQAGSILKRSEFEYIESGVGNYPINFYPILFYTGKVFPLTYPYHKINISDFNDFKLTRLKSVETTEYTATENLISLTEKFYNSNNHIKATEIHSQQSDGRKLINKIYYPSDLSGEPFMDELVGLNKVNDIIKTESFIQNPISGVNRHIETQRVEYTNTLNGTGAILPQYTLKKKDSFNTEIEFLKYDDSNNLIEFKKPGGSHQVIIWGYNDQYPIAKIENATYAEVASSLGQNVSTLEDNINEGNMLDISSLRVDLPQAMITTYTYEPLVGMRSMTDPKGQTTSYEYDDLNRLEKIRDDEGNLLQEYKYNYRSN